MATSSTHPTNRLGQETSPYLLQHAQNPVDWYPWGDEAFEAAREADKPIFLSVGYSACHWCHVMKRESFENPAIAALMNEHFINVKVDREERPDVDQIYMAAVQAMTQHGGWPMSVFLTPDGEPFFGGTYFPPEDRQGLSGFPRILRSVAETWNERRDEVRNVAGRLTEQLQNLGRVAAPAGAGELNVELLDDAFRALSRDFDTRDGGFGSAPKFPHPMDLRVLLRHHHRTGSTRALEMVHLSLDRMARGGIYDQLGGGFARYSTDERWLVPHFEKMLYDNALLTSVYLEAYQVTQDPEWARVARETIDYVHDRLTSPEGGFYSTEDAESEGVEGKYYVWSLAEVREILGDERAETFATVYDVSEQGNWEGQNILNLPRTFDQAADMLGRDENELREELRQSRQTLLKARDQRIPPGKDTKVLTSWNGLMIAALAESSRILKDERDLQAAEKAAGFLLDTMRTPDGHLLHSYKDDRARFNGYLEDYAYLIDGLTRLFEVSGNPRWINGALDLTEILINEFHDPEDGGFFFTSQGHETLITRPKDAIDSSTPSANAMAATALLRLAALTGRSELEETGRRALESARLLIERAPSAAGQSLIALDFLLGKTREFAVIAGSDSSEFREVLESIYGQFLPHKVVAPSSGPVPAELAERIPLLASRPSVDGRATTYICENFTCQAPVVGVSGLESALEGAGE